MKPIGRSGSLNFFARNNRPLLAWALFDLANTFFAVAMLSFYFPLWVVEDQGAKELWYSLALGLSMACVALLMPFAGALSDARGERMRFLRWTTYGCTGATLLIAFTNHLPTALILFGIANICYQLGTVFYDALLWRISQPEWSPSGAESRAMASEAERPNRARVEGSLGRMSGIGASFGYLGSALGLLVLWPFVRAGGHQAAFAPSAALFLLFALPSFLFIRDPSLSGPLAWRDLIRATGLRMAITIRAAHNIPGLWRYLWAAFFSSSAINTVLVFMVVYTKQVMKFTEPQIIQFFVCSQLFAIAGSLTFGRLIGWWGAKHTLTVIWLGWTMALILVAVAPIARWIWVAGPLIGFCLGSTWATSRVLITELAPKEQLGEFFGLAGLIGRSSSIIGPLLWGLVVWDPARYGHAVWMLIGLLVVGLWLLQGVPYPREVRG